MISHGGWVAAIGVASIALTAAFTSARSARDKGDNVFSRDVRRHGGAIGDGSFQSGPLKRDAAGAWVGAARVDGGAVPGEGSGLGRGQTLVSPVGSD